MKICRANVKQVPNTGQAFTHNNLRANPRPGQGGVQGQLWDERSSPGQHRGQEGVEEEVRNTEPCLGEKVCHINSGKDCLRVRDADIEQDTTEDIEDEVTNNIKKEGEEYFTPP